MIKHNGLDALYQSHAFIISFGIFLDFHIFVILLLGCRTRYLNDDWMIERGFMELKSDDPKKAW